MSMSTALAGIGRQPANLAAAWRGYTTSRTDFWIFAALLALAVIGAAISQFTPTGGRGYWIALVVVYGVVDVARSWFLAKSRNEPVWPLVRSQVLHWVGGLIAIQVLLWFEASGMTTRGPAADYTLLMLALTTFLAGVNSNWIFMLLGIVVGATAAALQELQQLTILVVTIPLGILALWIIDWHRHIHRTDRG